METNFSTCAFPVLNLTSFYTSFQHFFWSLFFISKEFSYEGIVVACCFVINMHVLITAVNIRADTTLAGLIQDSSAHIIPCVGVDSLYMY